MDEGEGRISNFNGQTSQFIEDMQKKMNSKNSQRNQCIRDFVGFMK